MTDFLSTRRAYAAVAALIATVTVLAYWPSLSVPFQFDDYARITGNWHLHAGNWLRGIGQLGGSRVIPAATLAFNVWLSGDDTTGYHVGNLLVHLAACSAVFCLAHLITRTPRISGSGPAAAPLLFSASAAALFACHPLQTQAVTYIIQRSASMATLFYVACVCFYLCGRLAQGRGRPGKRYFALAMVCAGAALLSKENAVTLPFAILLIEVAFFGRRHLGRLLRLGFIASPVLALPIVFKILSWRWRRGGDGDIALIDAIFSQGTEMPGAVGPLDYFMTQMLVLPRYLRLALVPVGLNVDHDVPIATGLDAGVVAGASLLVALVAIGIWALRAAPVLGFGILWVFITLSVESSFVPIHDVMMEHRMYLAMPGVALLFASAVTWLWARNRNAALVSAVVIVALLAVLTGARNLVWQSALSLWSDAAVKSPGKARVHINVGVAHHTVENFDAAISHYCRALAIDPEIALARDNIEIALEQQGRLAEVMAELEPKPVRMPGAPEGTIVLEYDVSSVVCEPGRTQ